MRYFYTILPGYGCISWCLVRIMGFTLCVFFLLVGLAPLFSLFPSLFLSLFSRALIAGFDLKYSGVDFC